jgi:hypothetical protein
MTEHEYQIIPSDDDFDTIAARLVGILEESFAADTTARGRGSATYFYLFGMKIMLAYLTGVTGVQGDPMAQRLHAQIDALRASNHARYGLDIPDPEDPHECH